MDEKKTKIIIASGIFLIVLIIISVIFVNIKKTKESSSSPIENVIGKIDYVDINAVGITTSNGKKLQLSILSEGVSFIKEIMQEDGVYLNENIALTDIPKDRDVNIQYNNKTNELMMIIVK